jgi:hydroxymethylpyrimidine/phosphomethylpyrimidine kinase
MKALDNAHKSEIKELINKWNNVIIPNFENEAALIEIELKKRHSNELEQFREQIEREHENAIVHYSGEILNLKKKSEVLGSQGFYKEAKQLKKKVKQLVGDEKEKHQQASKEKFINRSQLLVNKHQKELASIKKKHAT